LIPNASVANYLHPSRYGVATVNWDQFRRDSQYDAFRAAAVESGATPSTASWGSIDEDVGALFGQVSGDAELGDNRFRYNLGVRYVHTDQSITSRVTSFQAANATLPEGQKLPDNIVIGTKDSTYENWLPSANVAWNLTDQAVIRAGLSKTMTRANPTDMLGGVAIRNAD